MEPVDMIDEALRESNLGLGFPAQEKEVHEPDKKPGAAEHDDFDCHVDQLKTEEKRNQGRNGTVELFHVELERRQEGESGEGFEGKARDADRTNMLTDRSEVGGQVVIGGPNVVVENGALDTAEMCYDSIVLPTLPPDERHEAHEAPLEYAETYMTSPREREGVLMSAVPAPSSPSSYVQAFNMDVAGSTTVTASWEGLHSAHVGSGYGTVPSSSDDASPGGCNSIEERAFVDSLCEEPSKTDCLDIGKDPSLSSPVYESKGDIDPRFETIHSSGVSDPEHEYSSVLTAEDMTHGGGKRTSSALPRKGKASLGNLSLRNVLSDPITGAFMDDAMVAICGHSFGSGSLQRVLETRSCVNCGSNVPPNTLVPNFALRTAVLAYKHEDRSWQLSSMKGAKRRREQFQLPQDSELKGITKYYGGSAENTHADSSRPKGVQFPFAVSDRVLIKGNKRTPERFFGMEAVITSQCLNGWYLVRMLNTGESVRLQYRSLQKLGEIELPLSEEARLFVEQCGAVSGSPFGIDNLGGYPSVPKSSSEYGLESRSLPSQQDNTITTLCTATKCVKAHSTESLSVAPLKQSVVTADAGSSPILNGSTPTSAGEVVGDQRGRNMNTPNAVDDLSKPLDNVDEQVLVLDHMETLDAVSQKSGVDILNSMSPVHLEPDDGQFLHTGMNHDTGAKVWTTGTSMCCTEAPVLNTGQGSLDTLSADPVGDTQDGELHLVVRDQGNGNESFWTQSRQVAFQSKNSVVSGAVLQDSDPYCKVYASDSCRQSTKGESVVTVIPDHLPGDSMPLLNGTQGIGITSEKRHLKGLSITPMGTGKQGKDMKLKSANEILHIMRKDMLKLEKQIPRNYLLRSWRVHRVDWRGHVKASRTVSELGAQVRDFRYAVLLTTAGGMSNEEWDMRIALIIESGDVELLVSLWGRLYDDVYKWLESTRKVLQSKDFQSGRPSEDDMHDFCKQDLDVHGGVISSVLLTTAATLAAVNAVAEGHQDPDSSIKALLASTMKLLQQQSRTELLAVREALEWEKRHIAAKLASLEGKFANLIEAFEPNRMENDPPHLLFSSNSSCTRTCVSGSIVTTSGGIGGVTAIALRQDYETEEGDSDTALPKQDADGEATDMSDSD